MHCIFDKNFFGDWEEIFLECYCFGLSNFPPPEWVGKELGISLEGMLKAMVYWACCYLLVGWNKKEKRKTVPSRPLQSLLLRNDIIKIISRKLSL